MIYTGKIQNMQIARKTAVGMYLVPPDEPDHAGILLPNKYIKKDFLTGMIIEVFIYRDHEDRLTATTLRPRAAVGEIGLLEVLSVTEHGAFLDWGLEKDLFLPKSEQLYKLKNGDECLVYVRLDPKDHIYATMKVQNFLSYTDIFKPDDRVKGTVYKVVEGIGAFVAIEDRYISLLPETESFRPIKIGDKIDARIKNIKKDGKIDLSIREKAYTEIAGDAQKIYGYAAASGGYVEMNDKSDPEDIKKIFGMSKSSFKRALGKLLKEKMIIFTENGIRLTDHRPE